MYKEFCIVIIIHFVCLLGREVIAQPIGACATYNSICQKSASIEDGSVQKSISLEYNCFLQVKAGVSLFYKIPKYLEAYPEGKVILSQTGNQSISFQLPMAKYQGINYFHSDSGIWRKRIDIADKGINQYFKFEADFQTWEYLADTKELNGLHLQKAIWKNRQGVLQFEVWFCAEVPISIGPANIIGLPGLVVEAFHAPANEHFYLQAYEIGCKIENGSFWPPEFNEPFDYRGTIKQRTH